LELRERVRVANPRYFDLCSCLPFQFKFVVLLSPFLSITRLCGPLWKSRGGVGLGGNHFFGNLLRVSSIQGFSSTIGASLLCGRISFFGGILMFQHRIFAFIGVPLSSSSYLLLFLGESLQRLFLPLPKISLVSMSLLIVRFSTGLLFRFFVAQLFL